MKPRVAKCLGEDIKSETIDMGGVKLKLSEIYTDDFSQNGHNGADFVIVVPDTVKDQLTPYYSLYVAKLTEEPSDKLQGKLANLCGIY